MDVVAPHILLRLVVHERQLEGVYCDNAASPGGRHTTFGNRQLHFEKVLWISDDQKTCFSRYSDQLRIPEKIKKTDIYVETKMTPDQVVKTAEKLLEEFGYDRKDLSIDAS